MIIGICVAFLAFIVAGIAFWKDRIGFATVAAVVAVFSLGLSFSIGQATYNNRTIECTITDKDRGFNSEGSSEYRVYTEQCGTFVNQDSIIRGKFNSGDIQGQLQVGETYRLEVAGARLPFLSMFPNIFNVEPVDAN